MTRHRPTRDRSQKAPRNKLRTDLCVIMVASPSQRRIVDVRRRRWSWSRGRRPCRRHSLSCCYPSGTHPTSRPKKKQTDTQKHTHHNTTQHNTTQYNATQHDTTQQDTAQHNTTKHGTIQRGTCIHAYCSLSHYHSLSPSLSPVPMLTLATQTAPTPKYPDRIRDEIYNSLR